MKIVFLNNLHISCKLRSCVIQTYIANNDKDECRKDTHRYLGKGPDYLQHLMITDPTVQLGIRPDYPVIMHDTYTDYPRLDDRVGVCVMAFTRWKTKYRTNNH